MLSVASAKDWDVCGHYDWPASPHAALAEDRLCVGLVTTSSALALTARPIVKWGGGQRRRLPWAIVAEKPEFITQISGASARRGVRACLAAFAEKPSHHRRRGGGRRLVTSQRHTSRSI